MNIKTTLVATAAIMVLASLAVQAKDRERIANEGTIGDKWMLADGAKLATAEYPGYFAERGDDVCIALGYKINKDGTTSDFSVLRQWNSEAEDKEPVDGFWKAFAESAAHAVSQWKFKPRPDAGAPVTTLTVATLGFNGKKGVDPVALRGHCKIADLTDAIEQAKTKRAQRGSLNRHVEESKRDTLRAREVQDLLNH